MRNRLIRAAALVAAFTVGVGFTAVREPVAVVVSLNGKIELQKAGSTTAAAAAVGAALDAGDRLIVPQGGKAVLMYSTGKLETATATVTLAAPARENRGNLYQRTVNTIQQVATTDARRQPKASHRVMSLLNARAQANERRSPS